MPESTVRERDGVECNGFCPGYLFGYGFNVDKVNWTMPLDQSSTATFDLGLGGDTILTYCLASDGSPHFIHGFSYANNSWAGTLIQRDHCRMLEIFST